MAALIGSVTYYMNSAINTYAAAAAVRTTTASGGTGSATANTGPFDLGIKKTAQSRVGIAGSYFKYDLTYTNSRPAFATGVVITDTLPAGLTFYSATPAPTTVVGSVVKRNIPLVAGASTDHISLVVKIASTIASGTVVSNIAQITGIGRDTNLLNNASRLPIIVQR